MKFNNFIKVIGGSLGAIILGAIGSGLWEWLLSPGLKTLSNSITSTLSSVSKTYSDSIYSRASSIYNYDQSSSIIQFMLLCLSVWLFIYALSSKKEHHVVNFIHKRIVGYFKGWSGIVYSGSLLVLALFSFFTEISVSEIKQYSTKNMEIVRPYIIEKEYLILRSQYLNIKSESDFNIFLENLYEASSKSMIKVVEFDRSNV